jgi:hypothetical protein
MAAPKQDEPTQPPVWAVECRQTYVHRSYWAVWRYQPNVYGGRAYLMNNSRTDCKRFYSQAKAEVVAEKLNRLAAPPSPAEDKTA